MKLNLNMTDLTFSVSPKHCNKMSWEGCITKLGLPSDGVPGGADGHRIVITSEAGLAYHKTFEGMPLNCTFGVGLEGSSGDMFTGHGNLIIGYIEKAWVAGDELMASGFIWRDTFPEVAFQATNAKSSLGFSVEMYCPECETGEEDDFVYVKQFTGTGCAMLFSECAAFGDTYIRELVARRMKAEELTMNKEEMQLAISAGIEAAADKLTELVAGKVEETLTKLAELETAVATLDGKMEAQKAEVDADEVAELKTTIAALEASKAELEGKVTEITAQKEEVEQLKAALEAKITEPPARKTADGIVAMLSKFGTSDPKQKAGSFAEGLKANISAGLGKE